MTRAFEKVKQGLSEAVVHAKSKGKNTAGIKRYQPQALDVCRPRERLSLTHEQFAVRFVGGHAASLERDDRSPGGASLTLLNGIDRNPISVLQVFQWKNREATVKYAL